MMPVPSGPHSSLKPFASSASSSSLSSSLASSTSWRLTASPDQVRERVRDLVRKLERQRLLLRVEPEPELVERLERDHVGGAALHHRHIGAVLVEVV